MVLVSLATTEKTRYGTAERRRTLKSPLHFLVTFPFRVLRFHLRDSDACDLHIYSGSSHSAEWPTRKHKAILKFNCLGEGNTHGPLKLLCVGEVMPGRGWDIASRRSKGGSTAAQCTSYQFQCAAEGFNTRL